MFDFSRKICFDSRHKGSIHLQVKTIDSSQKFWLRAKTLTRNSESELSSRYFRVGTFESELSSRNFRVRTFKSELSSRNFRVGTFESELLSRNLWVRAFQSEFQVRISSQNFESEFSSRKYRLGSINLEVTFELVLSSRNFQVGTFESELSSRNFTHLPPIQ